MNKVKRNLATIKHGRKLFYNGYYLFLFFQYEKINDYNILRRHFILMSCINNRPRKILFLSELCRILKEGSPNEN